MITYGQNQLTKSTGPVELSIVIGCLFAGILTIIVSNIFVHGMHYDKLFFGLKQCLIITGFIWAWVRIVNFIDLNTAIKEDLYRFAVAWIIPLFFILILGFFRQKIPLNVIGIVGLVDLAIYLLIQLKKSDFTFIKIFFLGFSIAISLNLLAIHGHYPWIVDTYSAGGAYGDSYRDAAVLQAWKNYGVISFGVHGLMPGVYHPLFTFLITPFLDINISPFHFFKFLSFLFAPTLLLFSWTKIFNKSVLSSRKLKFLIPLVIFILTVAFWHIIATQRSVLVTSLIFVSAISVLLGMFRNHHSGSALPIFLLYLIVPLIVLGRAFDGLIWIIIVILLMFFVSNKCKIWLALLAVCSATLFLNLYGGGARSETGIVGIGFFELLFSPNIGPKILLLQTFLAVWILIIKFKLHWFKILQSDKIFIFYAFLALGTLLLTLRVRYATDAFYQIMPFCTIMFFVAAQHYSTAFHSKVMGAIELLKSSEELSFLKLPKVINVVNFKFFKLALLLSAIIIFLQIMLTTGMGHLLEERNFTRYYSKIKIFDEEKNTYLDAPLSIPCRGTFEDPFCKIRRAVLGSDINFKAVDQTPSSLIIQDIKKKVFDVYEKVGVYIDPDHAFWAQRQKRDFIASIIIMASTGKPLLFGVPASIDNNSMSIHEAKRFGGTLRKFESTQIDQKTLCAAANSVGLLSVIIYQNNSYDGKKIECHKS